MSRLPDCLGEWAHRPATYVRQGGSTLSYAEACAEARDNAARLQPLEVGGATVALLASNSIAFVAAYWALHFAGAVIVLLDPRSPAAELAALTRTCACDWIASDQASQGAAAALADAAGLGLMATRGTLLDVIHRPRHGPRHRHPPGVAVMCATSGSTGAPKAAMLSHDNLIANADAHIASLGLREDDVALVVLPLSFSYAHTSQLLSHTKLGGALVLYDRPVFVPKRLCELVEEHGVTVTSLVPTLLHILDGYPYLHRHDLRRLRYLCCGGAPLPAGVARSLMAKLPHVRLVHTYGLTEASPRVATLGPLDDGAKLPSIGRPLPGVEVEIVAGDGRPVEAGAVGELVVRGPNVMIGYCGAPEETRAILRDGWLHTGDLARRDDEGYLYLAGRKKYVIISAGSNVHPEEIEQVLLTHPGVADAVVRGEEHAGLGEVPVAFVALRPQATLSLQQMHEFLHGKLAAWKWPRQVYVLPTLARTHSGKTRRYRVH